MEYTNLRQYIDLCKTNNLEEILVMNENYISGKNTKYNYIFKNFNNYFGPDTKNMLSNLYTQYILQSGGLDLSKAMTKIGKAKKVARRASDIGKWVPIPQVRIAANVASKALDSVDKLETRVQGVVGKVEGVVGKVQTVAGQANMTLNNSTVQASPLAGQVNMGLNKSTNQATSYTGQSSSFTGQSNMASTDTPLFIHTRDADTSQDSSAYTSQDLPVDTIQSILQIEKTNKLIKKFKRKKSSRIKRKLSKKQRIINQIVKIIKKLQKKITKLQNNISNPKTKYTQEIILSKKELLNSKKELLNDAIEDYKCLKTNIDKYN